MQAISTCLLYTSIAATYAMHPDIYVMDEPLANLDPEGRAHILNLVVQVAQQRGKTLVIVEHSLEDVLPLVDRIILMNNGEILRDGPTNEVLAQGDIPRIFKRPDIMQMCIRDRSFIQIRNMETFLHSWLRSK